MARTDVVSGLLPGDQIRALREDVPGVVSLFVMPLSPPRLGALRKPTQCMLTDVFRFLRDRVVVGTDFYVLSPEFVPIAVSVNVSVEDPLTEQQVLAAVREAVVSFLWAASPGGAQGRGWPLGGRVDANEILTQVARVQVVAAVQGLVLFRRIADAWAAEPAIELTAYQLPELLGLAVASGDGVPDAPAEPVGGAPGPKAC